VLELPVISFLMKDHPSFYSPGNHVIPSPRDRNSKWPNHRIYPSPLLDECQSIFTNLEMRPSKNDGGLFVSSFLERFLTNVFLLNLEIRPQPPHSPTLVHFRQRLLEAGKSDLALRAVLKALEEEGFIARRSKHQFGLAVSSRFGRLISAIGHLFSPFMRSRLPRG
jgi:hypothetical protein